jgi:hypothetical protein
MRGPPQYQIRMRTDDGRSLRFEPAEGRTNYVGEFQQDGPGARKFYLDLVEAPGPNGLLLWPDERAVEGRERPKSAAKKS